jgi:hypothetical protein
MAQHHLVVSLLSLQPLVLRLTQEPLKTSKIR